MALLEANGFSAELVASARAATHRLTSVGYDAITIDVGLPDANGIDLIREIRQHAKLEDLPIIVVSGSLADDHEVQGTALDVVDWIQKPIDEEQLVSTLQRCARDRRSTRILHIEDDPDIVGLIEATTSELSVEVVNATDANAAREWMRQPERFDLIIVDLALAGGTSGEEILPLAQYSDGSPIPVVIFSATDVPEDYRAVVEAALLKTEATNESILETIQRAVSKSRSPEDHTVDAG